MERITRFRAGILILLLCAVLLFYSLKIFDLQVVETGGKIENATTFTTLTRVKAARGEILDRNGNLMVSNRASYDLVFNHFVILSTPNCNDYLLSLVQLCSDQGIAYTDHFPITKERPYEYTLDNFNSAWRTNFQSYLLTRDLDSDITAPFLMRQLRGIYDIPDEWTDEQARLVIGVRYELSLRRGNTTTLSNYVFLEDASDEALSAILELNVPGLNVEASTVREYNTAYAAHILGYVGKMTAEQWEKYKDFDYSMDAEVGQTGLEAAFEEYLHGTDGWRQDVVDKNGNLISSSYLTEPKAGSNVEVTIDLNLQEIAEQSLADVMKNLVNQDEKRDGHDAEGAAVVAMDVKTGQVLVCGSYPSYNPAEFFSNYNEILNGKYQPLNNRALEFTYPPGSTYKMNMVVAGIMNHTINMNTEIFDRGVYREYENFEPTCLLYVNSGGATHGNVNAAKALRGSCNYFFYWLGDHMPQSVIDATAKHLGLGEPTGVELPEAIGVRANEENKKRFYTGADTLWFAADQILSAIGQSINRFTPMQMCVYTSTLANQGTRYRATFLNRVVSSDYRNLLIDNKPEIVEVYPISDEAWQAYSTGMVMVTSDRDGTAYEHFGRLNYGITVAGKTGTADTDPSRSANGAFVCFAPVEDPQIAIVIYAEHAGHGSTLADVARKIMDVYFDVDEIGDMIIFENVAG